jgi:hypothetical protein
MFPIIQQGNAIMTVNMNTNVPTEPGKLHAGAMMNNQHNLDAVAKAGAEHKGAIALKAQNGASTGSTSSSSSTTDSTSSSVDAAGVHMKKLEGDLAFAKTLPAAPDGSTTVRDGAVKLAQAALDAVKTTTTSTSASSSSNTGTKSSSDKGSVQKTYEEGMRAKAAEQKDDAGLAASQAAIDAINGNIFSTSNSTAS